MSMKCPNPLCSYETPIHLLDTPKRQRGSKKRKKLGVRNQKNLLSQHLLENLHTCGRSAFVCSCKKFASLSLTSLQGHISNASPKDGGDHQILMVPDEQNIFNLNMNDNDDGVEEFRPPSPTQWTHAQKVQALEADATSRKALQPQPFAASELVKANLAIPTNTNEIRDRNIQYDTNLSEDQCGWCTMWATCEILRVIEKQTTPYLHWLGTVNHVMMYIECHRMSNMGASNAVLLLRDDLCYDGLIANEGQCFKAVLNDIHQH